MGRGFAYIFSVAAASTMMMVVEGQWPTTDADVLGILGFFWLVHAIVMAVISLPPFVALLWIADRFGLRGLPFAVAGALATALVSTFAFASLMLPGTAVDPEQLTFANGFYRYLGWTLPAAFVGGLVFWFCVRRESDAG